MASKKRMVNGDFMEGDQFSALPAKTQLLYVYIMLYSDDYGFCDKTQKAILASKTSRKDLEQLVKEGFLRRFDDGLVLVRHWWLHNSIQPSKRSETLFLKEKAMVIEDPEAFEKALSSKKVAFVYPLTGGNLAEDGGKNPPKGGNNPRDGGLIEERIKEINITEKKERLKERNPAPPEHQTAPLSETDRFEKLKEMKEVKPKEGGRISDIEGETYEEMMARVKADALRLGIAGGDAS